MEDSNIVELCLLAIAVGVAVFFYRAYVLPGIRLNALKNEYQNIAQPRLFTQAGETDTEFWQRVQRERARFIDVKNTWAVKQIPVIAILFNQSFVITWFGKEYPYNTVGLGQMEYNQMAFEIYCQLFAVWSREISVHGEQNVAMANGQKPFDPNKIWLQK